MKYSVSAAGQSFEIEVDPNHLVRVNGRPVYVGLEQVGGLPVYTLALDDAAHVLFVEEGQGEYRVEVRGRTYPVTVQLDRQALQPPRAECTNGPEGCHVITAPLAGNLVALEVAVGDRVEEQQVAAVVESMKMKIELRAPWRGVVEEVRGPPGKAVKQGEGLVSLRCD
jgi:biotin carboxyl carrier protein